MYQNSFFHIKNYLKKSICFIRFYFLFIYVVSMDGDKLAEKLNKLKEKFVEKKGRKAYEKIEKRYVDDDIDDKIDFEVAIKFIEEMERELNSE